MRNKILLNTISSMLLQFITVLVGLMIPRLILVSFGTETNGLISSITQMLSIISFLDLGIGSVVQVALYKPLSQKNYEQISLVYNAASKYFRNIAKILVIYIVVLIVYFVLFKNTEFSWIYTVSIIVAISISTFAQYYFGITNSLLLFADQKIYIPTLLNIITTILNAIGTVILILLNEPIQVVKFFTSIIFLLRPIILSIYVKKNYVIYKGKKYNNYKLPNKWSGMVQHITTMLTSSIDYIILTVFSTFSSLSIYNIYIMPLNSLRMLIESMSTTYKSYFGKLIVENNIKKLNFVFRRFELLIHYISTIIFGSVYIVLVPFVLLYTSGVNDANYQNACFSFFITTAYFLFTLRVVYTTLIFAAGHFKETQKYCIVESILNLLFSLILVKKFDIVGVAIGTCISVFYRLIVSANYVETKILIFNKGKFLKKIRLDIVCVLMVFFITRNIIICYSSVIGWVLGTFLVTIISFLITTIVYFIAYKNDILNVFIKITNK